MTLMRAKQMLADTFDATQVGRLFTTSSITETELAASVAGDGLDGGAGTALSVDAGDGLQIGGGIGGATALNIDVSDFAGNGLEDDASENLRINTSTATVTFTGGTWTWPVDNLQVTGTPRS